MKSEGLGNRTFGNGSLGCTLKATGSLPAPQAAAPLQERESCLTGEGASGSSQRPPI